MRDPNHSDVVPRANETFTEANLRLTKVAWESGISGPEAMAFYPLVGSLCLLAVRLIGRLVHRSR